MFHLIRGRADRAVVVVLTAALWNLVALPGCSRAPATVPPPAQDSNADAASVAGVAAAVVPAPAVVSRTHLTAALVDSRDVELSWKSDARDAGDECAWFVEFGIGAETDFSILTIVSPESTTFRHAELAAHTAFNYRIRPAIGRASDAVAITTGQLPAGTAPPIEVEGPLSEPSDAAAAFDKTPPRPLRSTAAVRAEATPAHLSATRSSPTSVDLRWRDRAADEEGFLVEVSLQPTRDFVVCALLPPDTSSFRKANLPERTRCYFRVRAFVHGQPSNVVTATTGGAATVK